MYGLHVLPKRKIQRFRRGYWFQTKAVILQVQVVQQSHWLGHSVVQQRVWLIGIKCNVCSVTKTRTLSKIVHCTMCLSCVTWCLVRIIIILNVSHNVM